MDVGLLPDGHWDKIYRKGHGYKKLCEVRQDHTSSINEMKLTSFKKSLQKECFKFSGVWV